MDIVQGINRIDQLMAPLLEEGGWEQVGFSYGEFLPGREGGQTVILCFPFPDRETGFHSYTEEHQYKTGRARRWIKKLGGGEGDPLLRVTLGLHSKSETIKAQVDVFMKGKVISMEREEAPTSYRLTTIINDAIEKGVLTLSECCGFLEDEKDRKSRLGRRLSRELREASQINKEEESI